MWSLFRLLVAGFLGTALGLAATWYSVRHVKSVSYVAIGPWRATPANATLAADPYGRAYMAHSGTVPLGLGEGMVLVARHDSSGQKLSGACTYRVSGAMPAARFWTLTAAARQPDARPAAAAGPAALSDSLTSGEAVWQRHGALAVDISRQPQPGNWLALQTKAAFAIKLRLYDTGATFVGPSTAPSMPLVQRVSCP
ncbi:MAG: DUF1214 domain-containing protein [Hyphomicrobiales bacterium]|nr:DUF1214 domain-containing protein [Hyphomicrobiales bacterium]